MNGTDAGTSGRGRLPDFTGDAVLIAGGARAILLQLAHPAVGAGVVHHSDFDERPLDRLWNTLSYVYAVSFGSDADRAIAVRAVNRAHAPVHGMPSGPTPGYSAFDPGLQLWVAATLYDTAVTVQERIFGSLTEAEADALYEGYAQVGTNLQLPPELWPADRAAFASYWEATSSTLSTDAAVRDAARRLLFPRNLPLYLRPAMPLARLVTAGLLPERVRALYGIRWNAGAERRLERVFRVTQRVWPVLPRPVRQWPKDRALRALRAQAAA